jgi:trigger factor
LTNELDDRLHDLGHRLEQQKLTVELFLQVTNQTADDLVARLREDSLKAVRVDLALRALVKAKGLEPTDDEINDELINTSISFGVDAAVLSENLRDTGRTVAFHSEVAKMKASKWLMSNVTYIDENGGVIDTAVLDAPASGDDSDSESDVNA